MEGITVSELVRQGAAAARVGDTAAARKLFQEALDRDEEAVGAWLGLSAVVESPDEKRRCFERVLELEPENAEALAGIEWLDKSYPQPSGEEMAGERDGTLYCANHPDTETLLRCNRCGKPICTRCTVRTPVGMRCKECVAEQQQVYFTARSLDNVTAAGVSFVLSALAGFLVLLIVPMVIFSWLITFFVTPMIGGAIAEVVRVSIGRRRSRRLNIIVGAAGGAGSLIAFLGLWFITGALPLLVFAIFCVMLVSTLIARIR